MKNSLYIILICSFINIINSKQIKNMNLPGCINCKYFKPKLFGEYTSTFNKCEYFGKKDLISNKISYEYADICRIDEEKCGKEGKYFEKDNLFEIKFILFKLINYSPYLFLLYFCYLSNSKIISLK